MKVKELLKDPSAWTQGVYARDAAGARVDPQDEKACRFCLLGAVRRCYPAEGRSEVYLKLALAVAARTGKTAWFSDFNDDKATTHADILAVVEQAGV
jgi:hypothetical protein